MSGSELSLPISFSNSFIFPFILISKVFNGFEDSVIDQVKNSSNNGVDSKNFLLLLRDMRNGNVYFNENNSQSVEISNILMAKDQPHPWWGHCHFPVSVRVLQVF